MIFNSYVNVYQRVVVRAALGFWGNLTIKMEQQLHINLPEFHITHKRTSDPQVIPTGNWANWYHLGLGWTLYFFWKWPICGWITYCTTMAIFYIYLSLFQGTDQLLSRTMLPSSAFCQLCGWLSPNWVIMDGFSSLNPMFFIIFWCSNPIFWIFWIFTHGKSW